MRRQRSTALPDTATDQPWRFEAISRDGTAQSDFRRRPALVGLAILFFAFAFDGQNGNARAAEPSLSETFESAATTWRFSSADVRYRVDGHRRLLGQGRGGSTCESIAVNAANGSYLYITLPTANCRVVSELTLTVWLKANRPDLQVLARVVLPHAPDPNTGKPLTALVRGSSYQQAGAWEQLRVENFPQAVERQLRVLRTQYGPSIDARGAYVDLAVLNVYGGEGATELSIDDLEVTGAVLVDAVAATQDRDGREASAASVARSDHSIELSGGILNVDNRPIFPRIIEYQGEPLALLAEMGFNGIRVNEPPSQALVEDAAQHHLWIVSPPPPLASRQVGAGRSVVEPISAKYDRVLVWSLGQNLTARDFDRVAETARQIRIADRERSRPLVYGAETDLLRYSRELRDFLSAYRFPLSTSLQLTDYGGWLRERQRLARPGTPFWTVIQTQPAGSMRAQWDALTEKLHLDHPTGGIDSDALRLLAFTAVGAGIRGLEFASHSPLNASDSETRIRALTLSILNAELELVAPWAAAGSYLAAADSNDPNMKAVLLQYATSRLLLVTHVGRDAQYVPQPATSNSVSLVVPGVPESHELIELTAGGLRPLKHKRVTGGTLITLDDFDTAAYVLMTPDPLMVNVVSRRLAGIASRSAQQQRELVTRTLAQAEAVAGRLPTETRDAEVNGALFAAAHRSLEESETMLRGGSARAAFIAARRANVPLGQLQRKLWERARLPLEGSVPTGGTVSNSSHGARTISSVASPFAGSFGTLPSHWKLMTALQGKAPQPNRLAAGELEDLPTMLQAGWRQLLHPLDGMETSVEVVPGGTSQGRSCLRMEVRAQAAAMATTLVETAPVWVVTPPVPVRRGEIVRIGGKVRVPTPIRGSVDGLLIVDSLGGEALAERIGETQHWEEFVMYRAAPRDGELTVTFALTGFGEAMIDDVEIQTIVP